MLEGLLQRHRGATGKAASTVVADSKYGTIDNFLARYDKGIRAHMPDLSRSASVREEKRGIFTETHFRYDRKRDIYNCPAGKELRPRRLHRDRDSIDYAATRTDCEGCPLRPRCTSNKMGRPVKDPAMAASDLRVGFSRVRLLFSNVLRLLTHICNYQAVSRSI